MTKQKTAFEKQLEDEVVVKCCKTCKFFAERPTADFNCPFVSYSSANLIYILKYPVVNWNLESDYCSKHQLEN